MARVAPRRRQPAAARPAARAGPTSTSATHAEMGRTPTAGLARAVPRAQRRRDARPRAARPHAAPPARPEGVHAADRRGDARPRSRRRRRPRSTTFDGAGEVDLIADFVEPLPVTVIAELLGIPEADRHLLRPWSRDFCLMYELDPPEASARRAVAASVEFGAYLRDLLRRTPRPARRRPHQRPGRGRRRRRPADRGRARRHVRPAPQRRSRGVRQRRRQRLVDAVPPPGRSSRASAPSRTLPSTAIDELLRFDTPLVALRALGPRGRSRSTASSCRVDPEVALQFASANRDPAAFDEPDASTSAATRTRTSRSGPGSTTASARRWRRLELQIAFATLLRRVPRLELVETPRWKPTFVLRGLEALRVRLRMTRALRRARRLVHDRDVASTPPSACPDQLVAALAGRRLDARARRQPRRQRLHVGRPDPRRAAGARRPRPGVRHAPHRRQRRRSRASRPTAYEANVVDDPRRAPGAAPGRSDRDRRDPGLHGHAARRATTATRAEQHDAIVREQRDHGAAGRASAASPSSTSSTSRSGRRRPVARRGRRAPPARRPVRPLGRADRARRRRRCSVA